jgi:3-dehydroquinate dehydratase-1
MTSPAESPLVVGTVRPAGLAALAALPASARDADVIEARFDLAVDSPAGGSADTRAANAAGGAVATPDLRPFFPACRHLEETGTPVLATIRLVADGGRFTVDAPRLAWFDEILDATPCSWIDIEVESAIAAAVARRARDRGRRVIVSHHDLARTPEPDRLEAIVDRARALGADVVKIATRVETLDDHDRLLELLRRRRGEPLAVIGMGPFGTSLRSYLPAVGSAMTYGFLDETAAPGQLPARELVARLVADCPAYAARRRPAKTPR